MWKGNIISGYLIVLLCMPFLIATLNAQYPDTIAVPVTFYDFHADGSNPEFNPDHIGGLYQNMVAPTLDAEGKPTLGPRPFFNYYIHKWFRPWTPGDFTIPVYTDNRGTYGGTRTVNYDTAFKNIVIHDTLKFWHIGNGQYMYENTSFFMLDGRGFGTEPTAAQGYRGPYHNYSFTMELRWKFRCQEGQTFSFRGDDDVWVFVDNRLVMDLGGIHGDLPGSFNVSDFEWLQPGKEYSFSLFYAERHTIASTIRITSNIFAPPAAVRLYPKPGTPDAGDNKPYGSQTTVRAGEPLVVYAHVFDDTGAWRPEYNQAIKFQINDPEAITQLNTSGNMTQMVSTEAHRQVTIIATFINPENGVQSTVSLTVTISPADPDHISIEGSAPNRQSRDDNPVGQVELTQNNLTRNLYAVVRDKYGNFVRDADQAVWSSLDSTIVRAEGKTNRNEGVITGLKNGQTTVKTSEPSNPQIRPATVAVRVSGIVERRKVTLVSATTRDYNGDGYLDRIELTFDSLVAFPLQPQSIPIVIKYGPTTLPVDSTSRTGEPATLHTLYLRQQITPQMQTGWKPTITILGLSGVADTDGFETKDGAGPVIWSAQFRQGQQIEPGLGGQSEGKFNYDTLIVIFSEPVIWNNPSASTPADIFNYFDSLGVQNMQAFSGIKASEMVTAPESVIIVITNTLRIIPGKDSVNIRGGITDLAQNQPNLKNEVDPQRENDKRVITGRRTNIWRPYAAPNPFNPTDPQSAKVPDRIVKIFEDAHARGELTDRPPISNGFVAVIAPLKESEAVGTIYDAVGNVVVAQRKLVRNPKTNELFFDWDGKNRNGRIVGGGTYTAVITVSSKEDGEKQTKKIKIGVKR